MRFKRRSDPRPVNARALHETVVGGGYCVGCGACAGVEGSPFEIAMDDRGRLGARVRADASLNDAPPTIGAVCPFSDASVDETTLAERRFEDGADYSPEIGFSRAVYAGHVADQEARARSSSGGLATWVLKKLIDTQEIDAALNVGPRDPRESSGRLFEFGVSTSGEDVAATSSSRYYPVELSQVVAHIKENPGRYAVTALPCFAKALRLLCASDPVLNERIRYVVGLVCGHLKSTRFAEMFAWQHGIAPDDLLAINFRKKMATGPANQYGVEVVGLVDGQTVTSVKRNAEHFGFLWSHGLLKYQGCEYCDDVVGETADLSVGDAWLPHYVDDSAGTSVVIARHPRLAQLIAEGRDAGELILDDIDAETAAQSQAGGFRHRRDGLAVRLAAKKLQGKWAPKKRVRPNWRPATLHRSIVYLMREIVSRRSHDLFAEARKAQDFDVFRKGMSKWLKVYAFVERASPEAVARKLTKSFRRQSAAR